MARIAKKAKSDGLYQAILTLQTEEEVYNFFQDLCTVTELRAMEQRFEVADTPHTLPRMLSRFPAFTVWQSRREPAVSSMKWIIPSR